MTKAEILLVEDDPNLSAVLLDYLEMLGYRVHCATDGEQGIRTFAAGHIDLCILDVMLPRKDGFTLAAEIRKISTTVPVIFLTARGSMEDRLNGFRAGCDDYISKPFSSEELSLRIEAILRRCALQPEKTEELRLGNYIFDARNMELRHPKGRQPLTQKEAALLGVLCRNRNALVTREQALIEVWGGDSYFSGRSMDVYITKLRKYLKYDPAVAIINVHGSGFRLEINGE